MIRMRLLRCLFLVPLLRGGVSGSLADLSKLLPLSDPLSDFPEDLLLLLPPLGGPGVGSLLSFPAGGRDEEAGGC